MVISLVHSSFLHFTPNQNPVEQINHHQNASSQAITELRDGYKITYIFREASL